MEAAPLRQAGYRRLRPVTGSAENRPLVVIALDASEPGDFAIELAGSLAGPAAPELLGLYVESSLLLEHARSHRAREILLTGAERALDRRVLERQLRSQAERARARFEATSARLGLACRFEVARGDILEEPIKRAASARALVIGLRWSASTPPAGFLQQMLDAELPLVLFAREGWHRGRSVAVVVNKLDAADATLEAAARIAKQSGSPLVVFLALEPDMDHAAITQAIENLLRDQGIGRSEIMLIQGTALAGIEQAARACHARLLVAPSPGEPEATQALGELMRRFPGALLIVRP